MEYMSCAEAAGNGAFQKDGCRNFVRGAHTGRFKIWQYVADTKGRGKAD